MLCADTSFLFSLYRKDAHSASALAFLGKASEPLALSALNEYELGNALHFAEFRSLLASGEAIRRQNAFAEDRIAGHWVPSGIALDAIMAQAGLISAQHTVKGGHRAFDILHVAHAKLAGAKVFLSFDVNQIALAGAVNLTIGP